MVEQGWQCPLCMTVWAPSVKSCECSKGDGAGVPLPRIGGWPGQPNIMPVIGVGGGAAVTVPGTVSFNQ